MSVPFVTYECTGCNLRGTGLLSAGYFLFFDDEGRERSIPRTTGYCATCDAIAPIEVFTISTNGSDYWKAEKAEEAARQAAISQAARSRGWLAFLLDLGRRGLLKLLPRSSTDRFIEGELQKEEEERQFVALIQATGRSPVCLRCGGDDVVKLPKPGPRDENGSLVRCGVHHPGCGGEFVAYDSNGVRWQPVIETRRYDWRTGRQTSGPPVGSDVDVVSGYAPPERPRSDRGFDI